MSFLAAIAVAEAASAGRMAPSPWGIPRGGAAKSSYAAKLEAVKEEVLASTLSSVRVYFRRLSFCGGMNRGF